MISLLNGSIRSLTSDKAVIEVQGVGYLVLITPRTSSRLTIGSDAMIFTSLVVREDSLTLFGFLDSNERDLYEVLQTVSGIGPKVALAITGALTSADLATAIAHEDLGTIEKVPGIGKKGAQRLVLELKGKLIGDVSPASRVQGNSPIREQLLSALTGLGFTSKESDNAINSTFAHLAQTGIDSATLDVTELLKLTLQSGKR
jgi:Holliday junction DNA helicase RuvA